MGIALGTPTSIIVYKGLTSDEETYLQYNLRIEELIEEEKKKENEIALVKKKWNKGSHRWKRYCEEATQNESLDNKFFGLGSNIFKLSH